MGAGVVCRRSGAPARGARRGGVQLLLRQLPAGGHHLGVPAGMCSKGVSAAGPLLRESLSSNLLPELRPA